MKFHKISSFFHKKDKTGNGKQSERKPWSRKKKLLLALVLVIVAATIAGAIVFLVVLKKDSGRGGAFGGFGASASMGANLMLSEDVVTASGVTNVGVTEDTFDVENLTTSLAIEEVYVLSGEEVSAGDKILKLDEEDVAEAREELERTLEDAKLAYRTGAIEYEQSLITAEYDRDSAILAGEQAKEVYEETIASLDAAVTKAEEELAEANEDIAEYESYVNDGSYEEYYKVTEYQETYDKNLATLTAKLAEYGISWSEVTSSASMGGGQMSGAMSGSATTGGSDERSQWVSILKNLYSILEQNLEDLNQAKEDCEDARTNASFALQTLQLKLPSLEQAVTEAKENRETQTAQAKLTYEQTLSSAERAERDYETDVEKAESEFETLTNTYEDAKENLQIFEDSVGDGYFYASGNGTILRLSVRTNGTLSSDSTVLMYSNPKELTVTVSVDQSDIAKLTVGDSAYVLSEDYVGYTGEVTEINPMSDSSSRASVTYSVTVKLVLDEEEDTTDSLTASESVTVLFGMTDGEMPSGGDMPQGGPSNS